VPVEVPTVEHADEIGREIARLVDAMRLDAVILASSDLTHYGPAYRFAPAGVGLSGLRWAKENDRRLLDRIERMDVDEIVPEVVANFNACGGGAIAAMLAACRELSANEARVLHHANSYETLAVIEPQLPDNAVGYASVVVG
jgi:AmmeMemoRadiSam system protein B